MAPRPEEDAFENSVGKPKIADLPFPNQGDEVVISGISGSFPDSDGMQMFRDKLLSKVDLVSSDDRRWKLDHPEIPQRTGKLYNLEKFDAAFFGVHRKQADVMDPMLRLALERVFEAIVDAGVNPWSLHGTKTGVFAGTSFSESEKTWFYDNIEMDGLGVTNCSRGSMANRISYWLGLVGPSYVVDTACSSSLYALERAYFAIRTGQCESAVVFGANLCLHPYVSLQFARLGVLSPDGRCKCFDAAANGYTRSEAVPAIFIQKAKDAKRIYARVVHAKTNCDGFKEHGITYPSGQMQLELLQEFYKECKIDPSSVSFVEAHGTGTKVGDPEECNTLDEVFCKNRKGPLLIGSVKSNMGHGEPASGLCSVAKAIIALESETIPPNLNFNTPKPSIVGLIEGRIQVVTEPIPLPGDKGLIAINSFGFGGANAHVLLEWNTKKKAAVGLPTDTIPRLVFASGRTDEAVHYIFNDINSRPMDVEFLQLVNELFSYGITGHNHRGYAIYGETGEATRFVENHEDLSNKNISFVFPGLGNQYKGMGKSLLRIPAFAASIESQQTSINFTNINLRSILTGDGIDLDNIKNAVLGVVAIQIGIVDCLSSVGVYPTAALGYSIGEIACAYAVKNLTAHQAISVAYYIASALQDNSKPNTATIQIDVDEIKAQSLISAGVEISSFNGQKNSSLVGPTFVIQKMRTMLNSLRIPAKEVNMCGVGLHSSHVADIEENLLNNLKKVIPFASPKNKEWIPYKFETHSHSYQTCSAQFFTKLILSPIYLSEAKAQLPDNSVILEIGPNSLLRSQIEKSSPLYLNLLDNNSIDGTMHFLKSLGSLYLSGVHINLPGIYPSVEYPVSRGTPMIGSLIKWDHSRDWFVPKFNGTKVSSEGETKVVLSLKSEDNAYLHGHMIDGRVLYPATGYINLVADIMNSRASNMSKEKLLVFEDIKFLRATPLNVDGAFHEFTVSLQKTTGRFEIMEGGAIVVTGEVSVYSDNFESHKADPSILRHKNEDLKDNVIMSSKDIYKELRLRGYYYSGAFRGLESVEYSGRRGQVKYTSNLVGFMDTMLQIQILNMKGRDLYVPVSIGRIVIDPKAMFYELQKTDPEDPVLPINYYNDVNIITAGGVQIWNLRAQQIPRRKPLADPVLEKYAFTPNTIIKKQKEDGEVEKMVQLMVHLALENLPGVKVKALEIADEALPVGSVLLAPYIATVLSNLPLIQADVRVVAEEDSVHVNNELNVTFDSKALATEKDCAIIVGSLLMQRPEVLKRALASLKTASFLISRENPGVVLQSEPFSILADYVIAEERFVLLRKKIEKVVQTVVIPLSSDFSWMNPLKEALLSNASKIIVLVEKELTSGVIGLVNCLTKEPAGEKIRCVYIRDFAAPSFDLNLPFYADQLEKDLIMNIYENGCWGSYRHQILGDVDSVPAQHIYVNNGVRGDLSSLAIYKGPNNVIAMSNELKQRAHIKVHYCAINFKDVLLVSGRIVLPVTIGNNELVIGLEYSGINEKGEKVMGILGLGAMNSLIVDPDPLFTWKIPDGFTLEQAATVPIVYATVYHAVIVNGRARRGESILIHSAAGGIGIAALNVAIGLGLEIFVTVGTQEKIDFLLKNFPQVAKNRIGNSRDITFEDMIKRETNGKGVDMVLNSLSDEKMDASLRCLAPRGRFLEIGKYDLLNNAQIDLKPFAQNVSYHSCMLDVALEGNEEMRKILKNDLENVLKSGFIRPLPSTVFDIAQPEQAFRYMTTGKHIGKVLMKVCDETPLHTPRIFNAVPRYFCNEKASYIIIGGLGGFGLELSNWLVTRGAKVLVLTSRSGVRNGYQRSRMQLWQDHNVKIHVATDDISTESGVTKLLNTANKLAPVAGIFNLAVVLKDSIFENQTEEMFKASFCGKANATTLLDKLSRTLCPKLEDFVVFSSVSCGRGNPGQSNYGMSNSIMERICEQRKKDGLPGLAVQWGAVGEVGLVAEMAESNQELVIGGTLQQTISSCLQCMDVFLNQPAPVVASMVVAEKRSLKGSSGTMVDTVCVILGIRDLKTVSHNTSLSELGMDSMMAVEIKQTLEREFEVFLTAQDLRSMTFAKLAAHDAAASSGTEIKTQNGKGFGLNILLRKMQPESEAEKKIVKLDTTNSDGPPVFFVPGLDGITSLFSNIAQKLKTAAYALTYPHNRPDNTSIRKTADIMLPVVIEHMGASKEFKIVGYSAGGLVAIELTLMLESLGYSGKVILIDGTPALCAAIIKGLGIGNSDDEITNAVLHSLQESIIGDADRTIFENVKSWDEKIVLLENKVMNQSEHRREYLKESTQSLILRLKNVMTYSTDKIIKSPVALIKPEEITCAEITSEDFELSKITSEPSDVITVKGNHISMLATPEIAEIISKKLQ